MQSNSIPEGALSGVFSVSSNKQVYFSQGNLQYIGSADTPYWKFAEHQYDCLGTTTGQGSAAINVDRDLFGWGTSGKRFVSKYGSNYQPYAISTVKVSYGPTDGKSSLTGTFADGDWGVYNAISNGGNEAGLWRTLNKNEWYYVFDARSTTSGVRYAKATVNGVNGVILLPDDWNTSYYRLVSFNTAGANFNVNSISSSDWSSKFEAHGAVFLPAAGYRYSTTISNVGNVGYYWSSTFYSSENAYHTTFFSSNLYSMAHNQTRCYGQSVRLVQDVTDEVS